MIVKCLFLVNGLGMGNSTRSYAVIQHLVEMGIEVHVLTSGRGLEFFADKSELASLSPMENLTYSATDGKLSAWKTLLSVLSHLELVRKKAAQIRQAAEKIRPHFAVIDSEYTVWPLHRLKIPIIGINNSDVVVTEYLRKKNKPSSICAQFWLVEFMDYLFHLFTCNLVLSPSIHPSPSPTGKYKQIGLIVRREVLEAAREANTPDYDLPREIKSVVFMLSGSTFSSKIDLENYDLPWEVNVVGRQGNNRHKIIFHGLLRDNVRLLKSADLLVVNGGFSAVSEALVLGKPTLVIPVPRHAEQFINGCFVHELKKGYVVTQETVLNQLKELFRSNQWEGLELNRSPLNGNGAIEAAAEILSYLRNHLKLTIPEREVVLGGG